MLQVKNSVVNTAAGATLLGVIAITSVTNCTATNTISPTFVTSTDSYCVSGDTTATGAGSQINLTPSYVDAVGGDYRITQTWADANLAGKGWNGTDIASWSYYDAPAGGSTYTLTAGPGTANTAGNNLAILASRLLAATAGAAATIGQSANLLANRIIKAGTANETSQGQPVSIKASRKLTAGSATETGTGSSANLLATRKLKAGAGQAQAQGYGVTFTFTATPPPPGVYLLTASAGMAQLNGQNATLRASRLITATPGQSANEGQAATIRANRKLASTAGQSSTEGQALHIKATRTISAGSGSETATGEPAKIKATRLFGISTGNATAYGLPILLKYSGFIEARINGFKISYSQDAQTIGYEVDPHTIKYN